MLLRNQKIYRLRLGKLFSVKFSIFDGFLKKFWHPGEFSIFIGKFGTGNEFPMYLCVFPAMRNNFHPFIPNFPISGANFQPLTHTHKDLPYVGDGIPTGTLGAGQIRLGAGYLSFFPVANFEITLWEYILGCFYNKTIEASLQKSISLIRVISYIYNKKFLKIFLTLMKKNYSTSLRKLTVSAIGSVL